MGMEGLGRLFNVTPIAAGKPVNLSQTGGVTFVCTGNDTFTLTVGTTQGSVATTPPTTAIGGGLVHNYYTNTSTDGTAGWVKVALASGSYVNAVTIASGTAVFTIYNAALAGISSSTKYTYVKVGVGGSGLVAAIVHDLDVQRAPANLQVLNA